MKKTQSVKGVIPIAMAFIIVLSLMLVATTGIFWSKTSLSVSRLKRYQAINYAKAALREAAHRFWGNYAGTDGVIWDAGAWAAGSSVPNPANRVVNVEGVQVTIAVAFEDVRNTPGDTSDDRIRVSARVNYGDIRL